jgi:hypothetical protein
VGHEAIVYGRIVGASWRVGERFTWTHDLNRQALAAVPEGDDWPWVVRGIFALPAPYPQGTYRRQVIHFGLSIKDEPFDRGIWDVWLGKFERVLRGLYWWSAVAHIATDFEPPRLAEWVPTEAAMGRLYDDPPQPVGDWVRSVCFAEPTQAEPIATANRGGS